MSHEEREMGIHPDQAHLAAQEPHTSAEPSPERTVREQRAYLQGVEDAQLVERTLAKIDAEPVTAQRDDLKRFVEWVAGLARGQHADPHETLSHIADQAAQTLARTWSQS